MRSTYMYGAGDVRVIDVPEPKIETSTDAVVRVTRACVCGIDLHPYHSMPTTADGAPMGHEFIGVVEEAGSEVATVSAISSSHRSRCPAVVASSVGPVCRHPA